MNKIESFKIDHLNLYPGLYVSRRDQKGDVTVTTFDLRITAPNHEPVIDVPALHTIEHLAATYLRNSKRQDDIVYFGPMGCRTGCYFLTRGMDGQDVIDLAREAFEFIAAYEGEIPGVSAVECGNYRDHDLVQAKIDAADMSDVLKDYTNLEYPTK